MEPLTPGELDEMRQAHRPYRHEPDAPDVWCDADDYRWPCDSARLLATLGAARQPADPSGLRDDIEALRSTAREQMKQAGALGPAAFFEGQVYAYGEVLRRLAAAPTEERLDPDGDAIGRAMHEASQESR
jgi:hypothetical protein